MLTLGAPFTKMVIASLAGKPPASVTLAVMTWVPAESAAVATDPPVPRAPSRSEDQAIPVVMSPSSGSLAVPVKVTLSPALKAAKSAGAVIATVGPALIVRVI